MKVKAIYENNIINCKQNASRFTLSLFPVNPILLFVNSLSTYQGCSNSVVLFKSQYSDDVILLVGLVHCNYYTCTSLYQAISCAEIGRLAFYSAHDCC